MNQTKVCRDCGQAKPVTEFWKRKASKDGLSLYCRDCFAQRNAVSHRKKAAAEGRQMKEFQRRRIVPEGMKYCPRCEEVKSVQDFGRNRSSRSGLSGYCKPCHSQVTRENRELNHGSGRNYLLKLRYGITERQADALLARQGGICVICLSAAGVHVDHDHDTGLVRGMLCFKCNNGLGQFEDEVGRVEGAAEYLEGRSSHSRRLWLETGKTSILGQSRRRLETWRGVKRADQRGSVRHYKLRLKYGITEAEADALVAMQNGLCAICMDREPEHIDHCHDSMAVRGALCVGCNSGMGLLGDDPGTLWRAAAYLGGSLVTEVPAAGGGTRLSFTLPDVDPARVAEDGWERVRSEDVRHRKALRDAAWEAEWVFDGPFADPFATALVGRSG
ncbi:endonuclease domain-containing protein [Actinomadura rupiterrae]|uniref:endonuclease domain-containing protein n=1 Tax=Actinomadura rupiterrae TaxID=559627 RepID=UPI0020A46107|nr:endonuclease domain-containing protein [Actinomadura rupiterrae]MCP2342614.1 RNA polymerase subunit RPABC4/transcription elongation factor Spt4 [Actinomadura rupiterrae]